MFQAGKVMELSGLTQNQLREWTVRRSILPPDVPGSGRGKHAIYSWATVLVLRILSQLKTDFHIEIGQFGEAARALRDGFLDSSFVGLYGKTLLISSRCGFQIVRNDEVTHGDVAIVIPLDKHLIALTRASEELPKQRQLSLIMAVSNE